MFSLVKRRALMIVFGFVLLALFIGIAGPYFAFGSYRPLESVMARVVAILLIVGGWAAWRLIKRLRSSRLSTRLAAAVLTPAGPPEAQISPEALKLREGFEEGVAALRQHRAGQNLYDVPWYVIIGAPGSGKTTALINSGLTFPLESRSGRGALRGIGGTRNCDWWFTEEAVFLDTAGRYTTQDSDAGADRAGWLEFLAQLRKHRKRRPLNGVILTISAQDLMTLGEAGREAHVDAIRRRLRELSDELRLQLPIYLMVTKCDLVAGFTDYFEELPQDGRAQVWGVTFAYEQSLGGETAEAFPAEFDALIARLNARVFARLEDDRDVRRRTSLFAFPQQMAALRDMLSAFISDIVAGSRLQPPALLRGVYFTSGTQEGTPIDRLMGSIARRFGVSADAVVPPTGRGKSFFVERLLKEVMIAESGLAGVNRRAEMRRAAAQLGAYAAMAILAVAGVFVLSVSYARNRGYVGEVAAVSEKLSAVPTVRAGAPVPVLLPRLDAVRAVVDVAEQYRDDTPWLMRWGLYQGNSVGASARDAYRRELEGLVLPLFAARIRQRLHENAANPEKLYAYLKAYLMLADARHFDRQYLQQLAKTEWDPAHQPGEAAAAKHLQGLLDRTDALQPVALNGALVAQAREAIRQASIPRIMYEQIKQAYAGDARAVRLDVAAGAGAEQVLRRKSGASLSQPIPALYSKTVFKEVTGTKMPALLKAFVEDSWVWGGDGSTSVNPLRLAADVTDTYERDYIAVWDGILEDMQLVSLPTVQRTTEVLGLLAGATSPLRGLFRAIADNTALIDLGENAPSGALATAKSKITEGIGTAVRTVQEATGTPTSTPGALVTAHFQPVQRSLAGPAGGAPIDRVLVQVGQIQQQLKALTPEVGGADPLDALSNPELRKNLQALQQEASTLPPLVGTLVTQIGQHARSSVIADAAGDLHLRYQQQVLRECNAVVGGRYPFVATSSIDMTLADFARIFGADGVFDKFFTENLASMVDTSTMPWRWRPGAVNISEGLLNQFELARLVRDSFFRPGTQTPQVTFTVAIADLDRADRRFILQIDGQNFDNRHGVNRKWPARWPASDPGFAAATFEDRAGAWPPTQQFDGVWAWLRLIEASQPQREPPLHTTIGFKQGDYGSQVIVEASSDRNPFASQGWRQFRCGS